MTARYISNTGSFTSPYTTWATAARTINQVMAVAAAGDIIYLANNWIENNSTTSNTYNIPGTISNPCQFISTDDLVNMPPTTVASGATINYAPVSNSTCTFIGNGSYWYGVIFQSSNSTGSTIIYTYSSVGAVYVFDNCQFQTTSTYNGSGFQFNTNGAMFAYGCTFSLNNSSNFVQFLTTSLYSIGCTYTWVTTQPSVYFSSSNSKLSFNDDNLSALTTNYFAGGTELTAYFSQCSLASSPTFLQGTSNSFPEVFVADSAYGNVQYAFVHYNNYGSTVAQTAIYENDSDGAVYDKESDPVAWKVTGNSNATMLMPYISPWIDQYNENTALVTPRLEICRSGSSTPYNNNQVWGEFSIKKTTSSTLATLDRSDRMTLVGSPAAQSNSSKSGSAWSGQGGTYWLGILNPSAAVTPQAPGFMRARVCVAGANTVYVNPKILGI